MSRQDNDNALPEREQVQMRSNLVATPGDAAPSPDVPDAPGQMPSTDAGRVSHANAAPAADSAADATTAVGFAPSATEEAVASKSPAPDRKPVHAGSSEKSRFRTARGWVALACVAFALAGMAFRVGIGTPSAFGIQQISAICPLGALETMAGAKSVVLHPLLLFVLVVALIALVGKAFCAWMCPVPWLQKFFRPKKRSVAKGGAGNGVSANSGAGREAAAKADAECDAPASCGDLDAGSVQAEPSASGASEARESQTRTASDAGRQIAYECVSAAVDECSNDTHDATTSASEHATNACAADSGFSLLDFTHVRAISGGKTAEPEETHPACSSSACAACAGAAACAKALAPVGGARDGVQLDSRHAVLVGTLASAAVFGFPVFCLICPVGLTFATIIGLWNLVQFDEPSWALVIFPIILIAEVTVLRKWCSKICPISALVGLLSNLNVTLRPQVKADACLRSRGVDCHACVDVCPEQLDPHSGRIPECSKCGKCVEACPAKAISIKLLK